MLDLSACPSFEVPFACIECPIRQVQLSCTRNNDYGDWKFWDRRRMKWPIGRNKIKNQGLLMELCRKNNCNSEYLRQLLISDKCVCKQIGNLKKTAPIIPFTEDCTYFELGCTDNYGYTPYDHLPPFVQHFLYKNPYDVKKPKIFGKINKNWLNELYKLYNSYVGTSPDDELEHLVEELRQRYRQFVQMNHPSFKRYNNNKKGAENRQIAGEENDQTQAKSRQIYTHFLTKAEQNHYRSRYKAILSR